MIGVALVKATPLLFCALAFLLASRAGVFNIGADGQFLAGALAATAVGTLTRMPALATTLGTRSATGRSSAMCR